MNRFHKIGLSDQAINWFSNYLSGGTQCVQAAGSFSSLLPVLKGVPQGSILEPLLFTIYAHNLYDNLPDAVCHLYASDTVICSSSSVSQSLNLLQSAFDTVQSCLTRLKLVINADKLKAMLFSNAKQLPPLLLSLSTVQGVEIETVRCYKYLSILIDENISFKRHINKYVSKLKLKLGFFFRLKVFLTPSQEAFDHFNLSPPDG